MKRLLLTATLMGLLLLPARSAAEVRSLTVGIDVNCPYGLAT
jgi:hypothetical protein